MSPSEVLEAVAAKALPAEATNPGYWAQTGHDWRFDYRRYSKRTVEAELLAGLVAELRSAGFRATRGLQAPDTQIGVVKHHVTPLRAERGAHTATIMIYPAQLAADDHDPESMVRMLTGWLTAAGFDGVDVERIEHEGGHFVDLLVRPLRAGVVEQCG